VLLHAGGDGFHIPIPDDVVEVEDLVLVVSGIPVGSPNLAGNVAHLNDPILGCLRGFSCGIPALCSGGFLVGFLCFCDGVVGFFKMFVMALSSLLFACLPFPFGMYIYHSASDI
jgi:hypothetical protein